jgi:hypothetical protein
MRLQDKELSQMTAFIWSFVARILTLCLFKCVFLSLSGFNVEYPTQDWLLNLDMTTAITIASLQKGIITEADLVVATNEVHFLPPPCLQDRLKSSLPLSEFA